VLVKTTRKFGEDSEVMSELAIGNVGSPNAAAKPYRGLRLAAKNT